MASDGPTWGAADDGGADLKTVSSCLVASAHHAVLLNIRILISNNIHVAVFSGFIKIINETILTKPPMRKEFQGGHQTWTNKLKYFQMAKSDECVHIFKINLNIKQYKSKISQTCSTNETSHDLFLLK